VLACTQPNGEVTFEEPTSEERELAMGFPRRFTAAPGLSEATRRELLGQAMDLDALMWVLAACRAGGRRRTAMLQVGGVAVVPERAGAPANFADGTTERGAGGARGLSRVSLPPQMGAGDTSTEGSGAQPAAGDTFAKESGSEREDRCGRGALGAGPRAAAQGEQQGGRLEGRTGVQNPEVARGQTCHTPEGQARSVGQQGGKASRQLGSKLEGRETVGQAQASSASEGPRGVPEGGWLVGEQLAKGDRGHVAAVVEENRDVFAFSLEEIGQFKLFEVELKLKSKSEQPIFERRRKHSLREWELVDKRCQEMEAAGIIEECDSDFAANSVMAAKKDPEGNWKLARFCTDLRAINEQMAQDRYPMPLPEEVLEGLGHAKFYSTIDIRGAFHQLVVKEAHRRKLAFWSSSKLYCWKRCPFGARNASAWF
jgi:hypothetical protein